MAVADSSLAGLTTTAPPNAGTFRLFSSSLRTSRALATARARSAAVAPATRRTAPRLAVDVSAKVVVVTAGAVVAGMLEADDVVGTTVVGVVVVTGATFVLTPAALRS